MHSQESGTLATGPAQALLATGLSAVPKLSPGDVRAAVTGGPSLELKSKQATLAVAKINVELRSRGLAPITAEELIGPGTKPTFSGCLDPCVGSTTEQLLGLIHNRVGGGTG